ncbi:MAG: Mini-ribonuclease 3 [Erysipelotrichaceae bacterium]|nr:ribonuclease III domain-containing protein [Bacillota bacterium]MDY3092309.1 ribonuclease III domain-containing protein [Erysipelotrichaceae bacterium]
MDRNDLTGVTLSFLGDAVYSLRVREYYLKQGYRQAKMLQKLCTNYVSAKGQTKVYERLLKDNFFNEEELEVFKRGRNAIGHIPKNGDLKTYTIASGIEAITGYLYLEDSKRLDEFFDKVFEGGIENE